MQNHQPKIHNFKKKRIGKKSLLEEIRKYKDKFPGIQKAGKTIFTPKINFFIAGFLIFFFVGMGVINIVKKIQVQKVFFLFGKDLEEDSSGKINILLLGTGGEGHEGGDLTDSIMIASIDQEKKKVNFVSIPRDLYVVEKDLGEAFIGSNGGMRINDMYFLAKKKFQNSQLALETAKNKIEEITGINIQYYVKVDFGGFKDIVDAIGGVDIYVPEAINDPTYPKGETGLYETFFIAQGQQHLDGEMALKYARSRHTTSDFSRSQRQQQILFAIKEKAQKENILGSAGKIEEIYEAVKSTIETNLTTRELISLAEAGMDMKRSSISNYLISDDPSTCGGFLYTPERELFGGAFVFIPATKNYKDIHQMMNVVLNNNEVLDTKIQILNATHKGMLAGRTKVILKRNCFNIQRFGNGESLDKTFTTYYRKAKTPLVDQTIAVLQEYIPGQISDIVPAKYLEPQYASNADIILELGADYLAHELKDPFDGIFELQKPKAPGTSEAPKTSEGTKTP